jgi:thiol-disulfide isomerase/thioredoxin
MPNFELGNANPSIGGELVNFSDRLQSNGLIILFECNHCPYVVASIDRINEMANFASSKEIGFIGINSNDASVYSSDSFENMQKRAEKGMPYPYLFDETQIVAETFDAKRTPEFFLFDGDGRLVYKGRMDDSPRNPNQVSRTELLDAISSLLEGRTIENKVTESIGCSVKWKQ